MKPNYITMDYVVTLYGQLKLATEPVKKTEILKVTIKETGNDANVNNSNKGQANDNRLPDKQKLRAENVSLRMPCNYYGKKYLVERLNKYDGWLLCTECYEEYK